MLLKRACFKDVALLKELQRKSYGRIVWSTFFIVTEMLMYHRFYLVFDKAYDKPIGFVAIRHRPLSLVLTNIAIIGSEQSKGFGARLIQWFVAQGELKRKRRVLYHTSVINHAMLLLGSRYGFEQVAYIKNYYVSGYHNGDAYILQKDLK